MIGRGRVDLGVEVRQDAHRGPRARPSGGSRRGSAEQSATRGSGRPAPPGAGRRTRRAARGSAGRRGGAGRRSPRTRRRRPGPRSGSRDTPARPAFLPLEVGDRRLVGDHPFQTRDNTDPSAAVLMRGLRSRCDGNAGWPAAMATRCWPAAPCDGSPSTADGGNRPGPRGPSLARCLFRIV